MSSLSPDVVDGFLQRHSAIPDEGIFPTGTTFGNWRIAAFVAKGGNGEVYRVENQVSGQVGALKVLITTSDTAKRERFLREARLLGQLKGPHFPRLFASGEVEGHPYFVIEFLEPVELPKTDRAIAHYLQEVCEAVGAVHRLGYVHRDLKPQNILRREDGTLVLIDYGLVKPIVFKSIPKEDSLSIVDGRPVGVGTPKYAAPEQFAGGDIAPATDIHALGVLAENLLQGRSASSWRQIIRRATSSIVSERYQSVDDLAVAIRRRHWLRNGILLGSACLLVAALAFCGVALNRLCMDPFTAQFQYEGVKDGRKAYSLDLNESLKIPEVKQPVTLKGPAVYRIKGSGVMCANLVGVGDVTIDLAGCSFYNETRVPMTKSSIRYILRGGVNLRFSNLQRKDNEDGLSRIDAAPGLFNRVMFCGEDPADTGFL